MLTDWWRTPHPDRAPLRVGLILDGTVVPRWVAEVVAHVHGGPQTRLCLVILGSAPARCPSRSPAGVMDRIRVFLGGLRPRGRALVRLYERWDRTHHHASSDPLAREDLGASLDGVPVLQAAPVCESGMVCLGREEEAEIRARNLDVLVRLGSVSTHSDASDVAKQGVWTPLIGGAVPLAALHGGLAELVRGDAVTEVTLDCSGPNGRRTVARAEFDTEPGLSASRNRVRPYWGATHLLMEVLHRLYVSGSADHPVRRGASSAPAASSGGAPTNRELARWLAPRLARKALRAFRAERTDHWRVAIRTGAKPAVQPEIGIAELGGFRVLEPPLGRSWADPFLIRHSGQAWLFYEDKEYAAGRARISCRRVDEEGALGEEFPCLVKPYHLSYPHVFHHDGEVFMIPESAQNGTVDLYRAAAFPHEWVLEKTLFRDRAFDTTLLVKDGRYWFFTAIGPRHGKGRFLYLFRADTLTGDWRYHPANPICTDVRGARGAGAIRRFGGDLYRPGQDGRWTYGHGFGFYRIDSLDEDRYEETRVIDVEPSWAPGLTGTHTYNEVDGIEVIDVKTEVVLPPARSGRR